MKAVSAIRVVAFPLFALLFLVCAVLAYHSVAMAGGAAEKDSATDVRDNGNRKPGSANTREERGEDADETVVDATEGKTVETTEKTDISANEAEDSPVLPKSCIPVNRLRERWWKERYEANRKRIAKGKVDFLLVGDSITHNWDNYGQVVAEYYYGDRNYVNMGFGGDETGHVLWRLRHSPMKRIHPKAAMLLVGINNLNEPANHAPEEVAQGTKVIVDQLLSYYPDIKILVLLTFVEGDNAAIPQRRRISQANAALIDLLRDYPNVVLKDINYLWLDDSNAVNKELMEDTLHPTEKGYWLWADAVEGDISRMLGVPPKGVPAGL